MPLGRKIRSYLRTLHGASLVITLGRMVLVQHRRLAMSSDKATAHREIVWDQAFRRKPWRKPALTIVGNDPYNQSLSQVILKRL